MSEHQFQTDYEEKAVCDSFNQNLNVGGGWLLLSNPKKGRVRLSTGQKKVENLQNNTEKGFHKK
ncbi:MAG: hypothetical protein ACRDBG_04350 [Waterburya sp.]